MKRFAIVAVVVLALVIARGAMAQGGMPPEVEPGDVPELPSFLELLAGPAGWVILGGFFSALLARWPWYNAQGDAVKRGLPIAFAIGAAIGARLLLTYVPDSFWEATAAYWYIIAGSLMTWLGTQGWFQAVVRPNRRQ